jgi:GrpB-like predicted nucleotidyltransferase (UPF0157 family)
MLKKRVAPVLGELAMRIEHVGSTSVPGLAAKPVIDLDVLLRAAADLPEAIRRLEAIGYQHEGDKGIAGRHAFHALDAGDIPHHLYACVPECAEFARHVALRDYLRSHPDDARRYGELKTQLAARHPEDINAYMAGKDALVRELVALATSAA